MPATIHSAAIVGIDARPVRVEADVGRGLPRVFIVGLPDTAVSEAKERIRSATRNAGFEFPYGRVTINLSPADWRKEGSGFDLPSAVAVLVATGHLPPVFDHCLLIGELALDGTVQSVPGVLAVAEVARRHGWKLICPRATLPEAALVHGLFILPLDHLSELATLVPNLDRGLVRGRGLKQSLATPEWDVWPTIIGQPQAKRAMIIAAAGHHNVLLSGPPGAGKTLLATAVRELLPPLTETEALEVTRIHSIAGQLPEHGFVQHRPFRHPHHTASVASLVGGGRIPKPGELSLAHRGILFLDEFPEFSRQHVEALRQPLESGVVSVNRVAGSLDFPAASMVVAAMNPCPCGWLHDQQRSCRCSPLMIDRYRRRISGPILDRFDLFVDVPRIPASDLKKTTNQNNTDPRSQIFSARQRQMDRTGVAGMTNSQLRGARLQQDTILPTPADELLRSAMDRLQLSMRAVHRILRVARTIADLDAQTDISLDHLAEALQFRPPTQL